MCALCCIISQESSRSEEAELVLVHRDEHVLGLAVVVEHHLVRLAAEAVLLVPAKRRVRGVRVVAQLRGKGPGQVLQGVCL